MCSTLIPSTVSRPTKAKTAVVSLVFWSHCDVLPICAQYWTWGRVLEICSRKICRNGEIFGLFTVALSLGT